LLLEEWGEGFGYYANDSGEKRASFCGASTIFAATKKTSCSFPFRFGWGPVFAERILDSQVIKKYIGVVHQIAA
jgi:hypothetical protein